MNLFFALALNTGLIFFIIKSAPAEESCASIYEGCVTECKTISEDSPHLKLKCKASCSGSYAGCDLGSIIPGFNYFFGPKSSE